MTLIEIIFIYADMVQEVGRVEANKWLCDTCCEPAVADNVMMSISDKGNFLVLAVDEPLGNELKEIPPMAVSWWFQ